MEFDYINPTVRETQLEIYFLSTDTFSKFHEATMMSYDKTLRSLKKIEKKIKTHESKISDYQETRTKPTEQDLQLYKELEFLYFEQHYETENMILLSEMKIIYIFKSLENRIKSIIKCAYSKTDLQEFYKWQVLIGFLKNSDIPVYNINGYTEVDELRKVSNCIKHDHLISEGAKKIREFADLSTFDHQSLEKFYKRIIPKLEIFCSDLGKAISNERFSFNDEKIDKITKELKDRMTETDLIRLKSRL